MGAQLSLIYPPGVQPVRGWAYPPVIVLPPPVATPQAAE